MHRPDNSKELEELKRDKDNLEDKIQKAKDAIKECREKLERLKGEKDALEHKR